MDMGILPALGSTLDETAGPAVFVSPTSPPSRAVASERGFPLAMATPGSNLRLVSYGCGRNAQRRLADQGLTVGVSISVVSNDACGPMIVGVRGVRIGLGKGLAHKVMVAPLETNL
ncbi:Fe2+ transport system protein FeoA [Breoghania corrubedonensis]|uniref:Fe2+ transport system protein FeoA n=1 Tax=Breoghania corrubedonensis TaxID=665038 RepID=A0A2T5VA22_9HYPH|nr:FeoA family protein [Breoghania corrubedonensis]PTW60571.1 Fe2+ transport system protein FeoA [Breoghania corrubedonensis]